MVSRASRFAACLRVARGIGPLSARALTEPLADWTEGSQPLPFGLALQPELPASRGASRTPAQLLPALPAAASTSGRGLHVSALPEGPPGSGGEAGMSMAEAVVLSQRISKARDIEELLELVDSHRERFNHFHITAAVTRLPKVLPSGQPASPAEERLMERILAMAAREAGDFDSTGLVATLWALGRMGCAQADVLAAVEGALPAQVPRLLPRQVANAVWAYGSLLRRPPADLLRALVQAVEESSRFLSPQGVSNVAWGMARLELGGELAALEALQARAVRLLRRPTGIGFGIGSRARSGAAEPSPAPAAAFKPQEVSSLLWALATMRCAPIVELLEGLLAHCTARAEAYKPQEIANLAWALASLKQQGVEMPQGLLDDALQAMERSALLDFSMFKPQEASALMWAFAVLCSQEHGGSPPTRLCEAVCSALASTAESFSSQSISNTVWSLATLRYLPARPEAATAVWDVVRRRPLADFADQALSNILWGMAELNLPPDHDALGRVTSELVGRDAAVPQAVCNTLWALAVFDAVTPEVFAALCRKIAADNRTHMHLHQVWLADLSLRHHPAQGFDNAVMAIREAAKASGECSSDDDSKMSSVHREVSVALRLMGVEHEVEAKASADLPRTVDVLIRHPGGCPIALEVDGVSHFAVNKPRHVLGGTALRNRQLEAAGLRVVSLHYLDWAVNKTMTQRQRLLQALLGRAGLRVELRP